MRSRLRSLLLLVASAIATSGLAACGDDDDTTLDVRSGSGTAYVSESEVQGLLDRRLEVQYAGPRRDDALTSELGPEPVTGLRLTTLPSGEKLDVLVFATPRAARAAEPGITSSAVVDGGGAFRRAANVVAVFPEDPGAYDGFREVAATFEDLARACEEPGDPELGELCFGSSDVRLPSTEPQPAGDEKIGPTGPGTQGAELLEQGSTVVVDGLAYTPLLARLLNPDLTPDRAILEGADVDQASGPLEVGVFVRVCNENGAPRTSTARLALKDAFGTRIEPVELPQDNAFAYRPRRLAAEECMPEDASAADETVGGRALVFLVPLEVSRNIPLGLEITSASGTRRTVEVGL